MAIQNFNSQPGRVGRLAGEILGHAMPVEVLGITGTQKEMPKNKGDNITFRRWLPRGGVDNRWVTGANVNTFAAEHLTTEGVTPSAETLTAVDVTAVLQQYSCLYAVTDRTVDLHEDNVSDEMKKQTGERVGLLRELVRYGELKGLSNIFYGGAGVSPGTVNGTVTVKMLRKITKSLKANHAKMVTSILSADGKFGSRSVEASYLVFCSTDMEPAIRDLPGFKHVADYGQRKLVHEQEIGSVESFRFILSPELAPNINAGALTGATGLFSSGTNIDLYPLIVVGEDVWGQVALRGHGSIDVTYIAPGEKTKSDPLGQRGYIGAKTYMAAKVLNNGWGAIAWVGTPDLA